MSKNPAQGRKTIPKRSNILKSTNQNIQSYYAMQNENEVLKLRNLEMEEKIGELKTELVNLTSNVSKEEEQCEQLKKQIRDTDYTQDMKLEQEKRMLEQKLEFNRGNCQIFTRKINEVRQSTMVEEGRMPGIKQEKKQLEVLLWQAKTENEGSKFVLLNLEKELERQRVENSELVAKRKQYSPKQMEITIIIENKLKQIKNREELVSQVIKKQSIQLLYLVLQKIKCDRLKMVLMILEKEGIKKRMIQKQLLLMSIIRKRYLGYIKNGVMQKFRMGFRAMNQLKGFERIIQNTNRRRMKNRMFRIWRNESNKRQYIKIRCLQAETTIEKIVQSYRNTLYFSAFNQIKYYHDNQLQRKGVLIIQSIAQSVYLRMVNTFMSTLIARNNRYMNELQVEESARCQSILLVTSVYFSNWAKMAKEGKLSNRFLKFKYFREMKKLCVQKKKRMLSEMLSLGYQKLKQIDCCSVIFCQMKKQTCRSLCDGLGEARQTIMDKKSQIVGKIDQVKTNQKELLGKFGWFKVLGVVRKLRQRYFDNWKKYCWIVEKVNLVLEMLHGKNKGDLSLGFGRIQLRSYEVIKIGMMKKIENGKSVHAKTEKQNIRMEQQLLNRPLELQKAGFIGMLRRLAKKEKEVKRKYFYLFMKNGYKCWVLRRRWGRVDSLMRMKIMERFIGEIRWIKEVGDRGRRIQDGVNIKILKYKNRLLNLSFTIFQIQAYRNKQTKQTLLTIFNRSLELQLYRSYNLIKRVYCQEVKTQYEELVGQVERKIAEMGRQSEEEEKQVNGLREIKREKDRKMRNMVILFWVGKRVKSLSSVTIQYFNKWRNKIKTEDNVRKFVGILQKKTKAAIKNQFMIGVIRRNGEESINQLKMQIKNNHQDLNKSNTYFERYVEESTNKIKNMELQNLTNDEQSKILQKKILYMESIKVDGYRTECQQRLKKKIFKLWRNSYQRFMDKWQQIEDIIGRELKKYTWGRIIFETKSILFQNKIRINLIDIYTRIFRKRTGSVFTIWRMTNLNRKILECKKQLKEEVIGQNEVIGRYKKIIKYYDGSIDGRISEWKKRKMFNSWKQYSRMKIENGKMKGKLDRWLFRGYQLEFWKLVLSEVGTQISNRKKADEFIQKQQKNKIKRLFYKLVTIVNQKKCIQRLFVRFLNYQLHNIFSYSFNKIQNYSQQMFIYKKNYNSCCLQKLVQLFDKKRKDIIYRNICRWRRNQFQIQIGKQLFKRLSRKAICNKFMDMFYAWKVQAQARKVLKYHLEEGEIKKRKIEIMRLQTFLKQFKKQKGLLLENEEGNFVVSPRFQKKKEEEDKRDKKLRYRFISRLIMYINGSQPMVKAYNNLQIFMKLRQKYKKAALFILNQLKKPDLLSVFGLWRKLNSKLKDTFNNMDRKQLIKVLNKEKVKLEIEYTQKLDIDEKIDKQLKRYKLLSYLKDKKQKLCSFILLRNAKKAKQFAFNLWRERGNEIRQQQGIQLSLKGQNRLANLQEQIRQLQSVEYETQQINHRLKNTIRQALEIADMVKIISEERDKLSHLISQKNLTCQSLVEENQVLNSKLHLAQKQAIRLLIISGEQP